MTVKIVFIPDSTEGIDGELVTTKREHHKTRSAEEIEKISE